MAKKTDQHSRPSAAMRADAALKAAVRRIEAEPGDDRHEAYARRISGAPSADGDKRN